MSKTQNVNHIFFGTDDFSVGVLEELKKAALLPNLIVTAPDRPAGRGQHMQMPPVKIWAQENEIETMQPGKLSPKFVKKISDREWDIFTLASYGKIVPQNVLDIPKHGVLNVHPSLLPKYRGASPIETAILNDDKETGVTIMLMDALVDHGPIITQEIVKFDEWLNKQEIVNYLSTVGGKILSNCIIPWVNGEISEKSQEHKDATYTEKIDRSDGEISFNAVLDIESNSQIAREIYLKIIAYDNWPSVYFFYNNKRVKITKGSWVNEKLKIDEVIPEGRKPMTWDGFVDGFINNN
jgi:methionyl-tRNA formyltransferase